MTVSSNYSSYASYSSSSAASSNVQRSKPDFEAMAQEMIASMDTDGNGSINSTEFTAALQSGSDKDISATANDIFLQLDSDSSGSMSTEEFMTALKASHPQPVQEGEMGSMPPPPPSDSSASSLESGASDIFSSLDTNQDGVITQDELMALFKQSSKQSETSANASKTDAASSNGDAFNNMRTKMLQQILSYYGSGSNTDTSSTLSLSA